MPDPDHATIRLALTTMPPACRFHGTNLNPTSPTREACCDTGKPALRRRAALEALDRLERDTQAPPSATVPPEMLTGLHRMLTTSSRDWGQYAPDAWLYGLLVGWDCEEQHEVHNDTCGEGTLRELAAQHGWSPEAIARLRRYRTAVRASTPTEADASLENCSTISHCFVSNRHTGLRGCTDRAATLLPADLAAAQFCQSCAAEFNPGDTTSDGTARSGASPWCRRCVDRCHDNDAADHRCPVCSTPTRAGT
jgi:hypothetical protein